jgi:alpha,alpha-trehalose phosphorylase
MIHDERLTRPESVYPADEWRMVETRFYPKYLAQSETFFSTANGYLGMRGNFVEGRPAYQNGTFVNGFYESWPIVYGEQAHGFAKTGQTILNVTDSKVIRLYVDDEPFFLPTASLKRFERVLDMKHGTLDREVIWETAPGKQVLIKCRRIVSFEHRHLAAISYEVTVLNADAPVAISSQILNEDTRQAEADDPRRPRGFRDRVLMPKVRLSGDRRIVLGHQTVSSGMTLACGIDHVIDTECEHSHSTSCGEDRGKVVFSVNARAGVPIRLFKYMTYHTSRSAPPEELCDRAGRTLDRATGDGFEKVEQGQRAFVADFWRRSDVQFEGDPYVQQALRFNLFHILQAAGRAEGVGIPAKGLTGQGYDGHYFWDTEIYVLPFLTYTAPRIARNLLKFRHSFLDKARARAREVNQKGALFPWRTINGEEASAYYAAGTAQYHINADIIYAVRRYVDATGDVEFLHGPGVEMLVETARLWADLGFYSKRQRGKFCIHGVTGPDEYNTVVNNNAYTNLMARENLWYAASSVRFLQSANPERYEDLVGDTGLTPEEVEEWRRAAEKMFVPFNKKLGIHPQDDSFLDKERLDLENLPKEKFPLLLHHHPLVIYRHAVIKQADVVLAMFLLGDEFSHEQKKRNFDFYDPLTTGDSSLSASIQAIIAFELGYLRRAMEYARYAALMDLADVGGNVKDGCHIASMGGTWMAVVYGAAGMRDYDGVLTFRPRYPRADLRVRFPLTVRGRMLQVEIGPEGVTYTLLEGDRLCLWHEDEEIELTRKEPVAKRAPSKAKPA